MSMLENFLGPFLRNLPVDKIMATPQVQEMQAMAKSVAADFATIKLQNAAILAKLDQLTRDDDLRGNTGVDTTLFETERRKQNG